MPHPLSGCQEALAGSHRYSPCGNGLQAISLAIRAAANVTERVKLTRSDSKSGGSAHVGLKPTIPSTPTTERVTLSKAKGLDSSASPQNDSLASPEGEGFPPSPKWALNHEIDTKISLVADLFLIRDNHCDKRLGLKIFLRHV